MISWRAGTTSLFPVAWLSAGASKLCEAGLHRAEGGEGLRGNDSGIGGTVGELHVIDEGVEVAALRGGVAANVSIGLHGVFKGHDEIEVTDAVEIE